MTTQAISKFNEKTEQPANDDIVVVEDISVPDTMRQTFANYRKHVRRSGGDDVAVYAVGDVGDTDFERLRLYWDSGNSEFVVKVEAGGTGSSRPMVLGGDDLQIPSSAKSGQFFVDHSDNQVVIGGTSDPDYGELFVHGRNPGSGADNDILATFGEDDDANELQGTNTGKVSLVQMQSPSLTAPSSVAPASLDTLRIEGAPDDSDGNVNPSEKHALNVEEGDVVFQPFDVTADGATADSPLVKIRGKFDSDSTSSVTSSDRDLTVQHVITATSPSSQVEFKLAGTEVMRLGDEPSVMVADGSASTPGLTFLNSQNTGFRRSGSDTVFVAGGSDIFRTNGSGGISLESDSGFLTWRSHSALIRANSNGTLRFRSGGSGAIEHEFFSQGSLSADSDVSIKHNYNVGGSGTGTVVGHDILADTSSADVASHFLFRAGLDADGNGALDTERFRIDAASPANDSTNLFLARTDSAGNTSLQQVTIDEADLGSGSKKYLIAAA